MNNMNDEFVYIIYMITLPGTLLLLKDTFLRVCLSQKCNFDKDTFISINAENKSPFLYNNVNIGRFWY